MNADPMTSAATAAQSTAPKPKASPPRPVMQATKPAPRLGYVCSECGEHIVAIRKIRVTLPALLCPQHVEVPA
jgi:hypothetical protein